MNSHLQMFFKLRVLKYFAIFTGKQETNSKGYANVTAPNHIADELVKLNDIELRGHHLIIEEAAGKPKTLNSQYN